MACVIFPRLCVCSTKKKKAKLRDGWNKIYPSQLWELLLQLSDGNAFSFSVNFTSHRKIPSYLLAQSLALPQSPCPQSLFHGEICASSASESSKRHIKMMAKR